MTSPMNNAPNVDASAINHAAISALSGETRFWGVLGLIVFNVAFVSVHCRWYDRRNHE